MPYHGGVAEIKTKPTQHSVKELRSIGIQPDVLVCRSEHALPREQRAKIALFTNVEERAVISAVDVDDIYKIPMLLNEQGLDSYVVDKLRLDAPGPRISRSGRRVVDAKAHPEAEVTIAMVGKYVDLARLLHVADRGAAARRHPHAHAREHPLHGVRRHPDEGHERA